MIKIKEARKRKNLAQKELAKILGISPQAVSGYENGYREADYKTLCKIAEILETTTDYLLGVEDESGFTYRHKDPALTETEKEIISAYRKIPPAKHPQALALLNVLIDKTLIN